MDNRKKNNEIITDEYSNKQLSSSYISIIDMIGFYESETEPTFTSLHDAVNRKDFYRGREVNLAQVSAFIVSGVDVNQKIDCELGSIYRKEKFNDVTPLHVAVYHHQAPMHPHHNNELLTLLLDNGADVNAPDRNGDTPLHYATGHNGNKDFSHWGSHPTDDAEKRNTMRLLLKHGAVPSIKNFAGVDCRHAVAPLVRSDWFLEWRKAKYENDEARSRECDQDIGRLIKEHICKLIDELKMLYDKNDIDMLQITIADAKGCEIYVGNSFFAKALKTDTLLASILGEISSTVPATNKVYDPKHKNPYLAQPSVNTISETDSTMLRLA